MEAIDIHPAWSEVLACYTMSESELVSMCSVAKQGPSVDYDQQGHYNNMKQNSQKSSPGLFIALLTQTDSPRGCHDRRGVYYRNFERKAERLAELYCYSIGQPKVYESYKVRGFIGLPI